MLNVEII